LYYFFLLQYRQFLLLSDNDVSLRIDAVTPDEYLMPCERFEDSPLCIFFNSSPEDVAGTL
jgi:hypothetical protein